MPVCGIFFIGFLLTRRATEGFMEQMTITLLLSLFLCCFVVDANGADLVKTEQTGFEEKRFPYVNNNIHEMEIVRQDVNEDFGNEKQWSFAEKLQKRYGIGPHHRVSTLNEATINN